MTEYAIKTKGLSRTFGGVRAVDGLDLGVRYGEIFGLIGPDGAGKTTTMRMLAGVMAVDGGDAQVLGHDVVNEPESVKTDIAYMSQRFGLYEDLTVRENIDFYAELYLVDAAEKKERFDRLMEFSRLSPFTGRLAGNLSGGMKQKLGLACALIHTPKLLLLDEPTNGVDPVSRREFWKILYELLREGVTIFVSTPYMDEADRCHRVGVMDKGRLLIADTPMGIRERIRISVIEIFCDEGRRAQKALERVRGVKGVVFFGDKLHVSVGEGVDEGTMRGTLEEHGIAFRSVRSIIPSLEDIFFELS
ncbi:MAG: ABC transporter ATP-binding protein [Deltaproteobacteria bacterium]|nr:ABC transporter ATP-binding protein [Candidatus Zymogenaceae bacterium]